MLQKRKNVNEELGEQLKGKNNTIEEYQKKLAYFENLECENKDEIKRLSEQTYQDQCEIDKLKEDIDDLEMKVWNGEEDYKNLMFTKECVEEDLANEMEKIKNEIKEKGQTIKELNQTIKKNKESESDTKFSDKNLEKEGTIDEIADDLKYVCDKCKFTGKSENNMKMHLGKEHKFMCKLCEYRSTTKLQLSSMIKKEHH